MGSKRLLYQSALLLGLGIVSAVRAPRVEAASFNGRAAMECGNLICATDCDALWLDLDCGSCSGDSFPVCNPQDFVHCDGWAFGYCGAAS